MALSFLIVRASQKEKGKTFAHRRRKNFDKQREERGRRRTTRMRATPLQFAIITFPGQMDCARGRRRILGRKSYGRVIALGISRYDFTVPDMIPTKNSSGRPIKLKWHTCECRARLHACICTVRGVEATTRTCDVYVNETA